MRITPASIECRLTRDELLELVKYHAGELVDYVVNVEISRKATGIFPGDKLIRLWQLHDLVGKGNYIDAIREALARHSGISMARSSESPANRPKTV